MKASSAATEAALKKEGYDNEEKEENDNRSQRKSLC